MTDSPKAWKVGRYDVLPTTLDDQDGRGLLYVWQEAQAHATYVVGVDPTLGIPGWNRQLRTKDDVKVDNAAISVLKKGQWLQNGDRTPDVQVAEWAAPVDPYDLAHVCNVIGKTYAGDNEEGQALMAIEVQPGPGWATQTELVNRYGYMNFPPWLVTDGLLQHAKQKFGWYSSRSTRSDLWTKNLMLIRKGGVIPRSPWLIDEMADCTPDSFLAVTGRARNGLHDDRVIAFFLSVWYCLPPTAILSLADGSYRQIVDIRAGDVVLGRDGLEGVVGTFSRPYRGKMQQLRISGNYQPLVCTPEHRVLVQKLRDMRGNRKERNKAGSPLEWVEAKDVKPRYRVLLPARFDLPKFKLSAERLRVLGWYMAEGYINKYGINFTLGPHEAVEADFIRRVLDDWMADWQPTYRGQKSRKARIRRARTSLIVSINSPVLSAFFLKHIGTGSKTKRLSPQLFESSGLQQMILGWIAGDGHRTARGQVHICTVSHVLAHQMRQVLLNHGIWCVLVQRLMKARILEGRQLADSLFYDLQIGTGWMNVLDGREGNGHLRYQKVTRVAEGFLTPVLANSAVDYDGFVYDIETTSHSFVADGVVVHNCQEWGLDIEPRERNVVEQANSKSDYQTQAISSEAMLQNWNDRFEELMEE